MSRDARHFHAVDMRLAGTFVGRQNVYAKEDTRAMERCAQILTNAQTLTNSTTVKVAQPAMIRMDRLNADAEVALLKSGAA